MSEHVVRLRDVTVRYQRGDVAIDRVSLTIATGERVAIVGPSGAGKSTLVNLVNGRVQDDGATVSGGVDVLGVDPAQIGGTRRRRHARRIGTVRQALDLVGPMRVLHNINAGRLGVWGLRRSLWSLIRPFDSETAGDLLEAVGLERELLDARVDELSGGQQQRVAIARLLAQAPELVVADEPVASLDPALSEVVLRLLLEPPAGDGWTTLVSLHQPELAVRFADRIIGMANGRIVFDRPSTDVGAADFDALYAR